MTGHPTAHTVEHTEGTQGIVTAGITGRIAVVTGAAGGIGGAVAAALAGHGAVVATTDTAATGIAGAGTTATGTGTRGSKTTNPHWYRLDVRDADQVSQTVARIEHELGPIGILVNVAGILRTGPVHTFAVPDWDDLFAVNTRGVFLTSREVARRMIPRRQGAIVTVSSNAAGVPRAGMAGYAASKAATTAFTKSLGLELARYGIRCNVVAPGSTDTTMQRALWSGPDGAAAIIAGDPTAFRTGIPLGRLAEPADIAEAVLFLASDRARHITMHDLYVDGGATLRG